MKIRTVVFLFVLGLAVVGLSSSCDRERFTYAEVVTEYGTMRIKLYNTTPKHRDNFIELAQKGYYDGTLFHRVIKGFMIQGGDPLSINAPKDLPLGSGGPEYTIPPEIGAYHFKGAIAAARRGDAVNPGKESSGSQFYIVQGNLQKKKNLKQIAMSKGITYTQDEINKYMEIGGTPALDNEYTVFGEVVEGFEVIDAIAGQQINRANRPNEDILMKVRIVQ